MEGARQLLPPPVEMGDRRWMDGVRGREAAGTAQASSTAHERHDPHTQYRFLRVLGTGSFGAVYLCSDLGSGELSAIKALDKHHPEHDRGAVLREIAILARVGDHPNVASLREVWEDAAYIFVVQEACMGGELFDCITLHHEFSEREAARAVVVILSVMAHCRARGVLHRDIKPENWLLKRSEPGRLSPKNMRAVDFGASIFREEDEPCHEPVGSTYYVAPEVLQGAYSWPADMWSLGVLIFVLLSGQPPFWGTADSIIFHKILHEPVDFSSSTWRRVSAQAKDFVGQLLEKDPAARLTVAQAANHPWVRHAALAPDAPMGASLVPRLHAFVGQDRLRRMLLTLAARHLSAASIGELRVACAELDEDGDGLIRLADLSAALERSGVALQDPAISELLAGLDPRHEGSVSVDEFVAAALDHQKVLTATTINAIFAELDADKDGLLDVEELSFALEECRIDVGADALRSLMDHSGALNTAGMVSARSFQDLILGAQRAGAPPAGLDAISDQGSSFEGEYSSEEVGDLNLEEEDEDASSYATDSSVEAASASPSPPPAP
ncbi:protein kinase, partial [Helicosporidium sp. ATCC 50920]